MQRIIPASTGWTFYSRAACAACLASSPTRMAASHFLGGAEGVRGRAPVRQGRGFASASEAHAPLSRGSVSRLPRLSRASDDVRPDAAAQQPGQRLVDGQAAGAAARLGCWQATPSSYGPRMSASCSSTASSPQGGGKAARLARQQYLSPAGSTECNTAQMLPPPDADMQESILCVPVEEKKGAMTALLSAPRDEYNDAVALPADDQPLLSRRAGSAGLRFCTGRPACAAG